MAHETHGGEAHVQQVGLKGLWEGEEVAWVDTNAIQFTLTSESAKSKKTKIWLASCGEIIGTHFKCFFVFFVFIMLVGGCGCIYQIL